MPPSEVSNETLRRETNNQCIQFMTDGHGACPTANAANVSFNMAVPAGGITLTDLVVSTAVAQGAGTATLSVRDNGTPVMSCSITGAAVFSCRTTGSVVVSAGHFLQLQLTLSSGTNTDVAAALAFH
jgi:hypothetical protein